jgi:hypothetical protein
MELSLQINEINTTVKLTQATVFFDRLGLTLPDSLTFRVTLKLGYVTNNLLKFSSQSKLAQSRAHSGGYV